MEPPTSNQSSNISNRNLKPEIDLKCLIIEFMRERPFLWNSKHPNYKDHKRRDQEFQAFSKEVGKSVQDIKRVWHVLRTNFFRAHKLIVEKTHSSNPTEGSAGTSGGREKSNKSNTTTNNNNNTHNGEKIWKYYLSMEYILEGAKTSTAKNISSNSNNNNNQTSDDSSLAKESRQTKNPKVFKDLRGLRRDAASAANQNNNSNQNNNQSSTSTANSSGIQNGGGISCLAALTRSSNNVSLNSSAASQDRSTSTLFNDSYGSSMEADDDHLYARSLIATLKKFDPTTKEVIKLKFQEIIVDQMQGSRSGK